MLRANDYGFFTDPHVWISALEGGLPGGPISAARKQGAEMRCKFCGQPAGFLRFSHAACATKHLAGRKDLLALITASSSSMPTGELARQAEQISEQSHIGPSELRLLLAQGWRTVLDKALDSDGLDKATEEHLSRLRGEFELTQPELEADGSLSRAAKAVVIREVLNGNVPSLVRVEGALPFNFTKNEQIVWVFNSVDLWEDRVRREYVGRSSGVSVRVARGIYIRTGQFRGTPVEYKQRVKIDSGTVAITNKNFYFAGASRGTRVALTKIVTIEPHSNGVTITKDGAKKAQTFVTGDGWFTYNLVSNLSRL